MAKQKLAIGDCFKIKSGRNEGDIIKITSWLSGIDCYRGTFAKWGDPDYINQNVEMGPWSEKELIPVSKQAFQKVRNAAVRDWAETWAKPPAEEETVAEDEIPPKKTTKKKSIRNKTPKTTKKQVKGTQIKRKPRGLALVKAREEAAAKKQTAGSSQDMLNAAIASKTVKKSSSRNKNPKSAQNLENFL